MSPKKDFFDLKNLSDSQLARWDQATLEYVRIREKNVNDKLLRMTEREKKDLLSMVPNRMFSLRELIELEYARKGGEGSSKSALFARMLDGKKPLMFPPPLYFGFPWYDVFDFSVVEEVSAKIDWASGSPKVLIGGHEWKVFRQESECRWLISCGEWSSMDPPVVWVLERIRILAKASRFFIPSWHDPSLQRICTLEELKAEVFWNVNQQFKAMEAFKNASSSDLALARKGEFGQHLNPSDVHRLRLIQQGMEYISMRKRNGLKPIAENSERIKLVNQIFESYFDKNQDEGFYESSDDGELIKVTWNLERLPSFVLDGIKP